MVGVPPFIGTPGGWVSDRDERSAAGARRSLIEQKIVDELLRWPELRSERSRDLLLDTLARSGGPAHLSDYPTAAQWYLALVAVCSDQQHLPELCSAAGRVHPPAAPVLSQLVKAWHIAAMTGVPATQSMAGIQPGTSMNGPPGRDGLPIRPAGVQSPGSFSGAELSALALAFSTPDTAGGLLDRAGVPRDRQPHWSAGTSSRNYWATMAELIDLGILSDGRSRVLAAARHDFPANPAFACGSPGNGTGDGTGRPPSADPPGDWEAHR